MPEDEAAVAIDPQQLKKMIEQVAFAAAQDESRPVLTGVLADMTSSSLTLAAADGYRLSVRTIDLAEGQGSHACDHPGARTQ